MRALIVIGLASLIWAGASRFVTPARPDLAYLPVAWLGAMTALWALAWLIPMAIALVPRRRQVLPDAATAWRIAAVFAIAMVLLGLGFTHHQHLPDTPPRLFVENAAQCIAFALAVASGPFLLCMRSLRYAAPVDGWGLGAAVGAAGAALGGLSLQFFCPVAPDGLHVGLAHGGAIIVGGICGALLAPVFLRE